MTVIDQLLVGKLSSLGPRAAPSGIDKRPVSGALYLDLEGFGEDVQGDRKHHGGPEKAVHHYPFDHYDYWREAIGQRLVLDRPGAFGENFSSSGLTEADVAVGDVFRLGQAIIQVSQGRQPCWKLNIRFDTSDMSSRVQKSGHTGWYYRVLQPGLVAPGDALELDDRLSPDWTVRRLWHVLYVDTMNLDALAEIAALDHLPGNWRGYAQKRLQTRQVEDWSRRLQG